jgi:hypothetical protein
MPGKSNVVSPFSRRSSATRLILLSLAGAVSKMPDRTVGNQGLVPRGTFREHFTFHSWQAEMDCQTAFEREADSQTRLAP